jgi:hypothetical protein
MVSPVDDFLSLCSEDGVVLLRCLALHDSSEYGSHLRAVLQPLLASGKSTLSYA